MVERSDLHHLSSKKLGAKQSLFLSIPIQGEVAELASTYLPHKLQL